MSDENVVDLFDRAVAEVPAALLPAPHAAIRRRVRRRRVAGWGESLWVSSSGGLAGLVVRLVSEHGEEDVDAAAGEADEGGVVAFACGAIAVVVGP